MNKSLSITINKTDSYCSIFLSLSDLSKIHMLEIAEQLLLIERKDVIDIGALKKISENSVPETFV